MPSPWTYVCPEFEYRHVTIQTNVPLEICKKRHCFGHSAFDTETPRRQPDGRTTTRVSLNLYGTVDIVWLQRPRMYEHNFARGRLRDFVAWRWPSSEQNCTGPEVLRLRSSAKRCSYSGTNYGEYLWGLGKIIFRYPYMLSSFYSKPRGLYTLNSVV